MQKFYILPGWLTIEGAMAYCGPGRSVLSEAISSGAIESRLRHRRLIKRESLDAWIESGERRKVALQKTTTPAGNGGEE